MDAWIPQRIERNDNGKVVGRSRLVDCANIYHPTKPAGTGMLTVLTIDPEAPADTTTTAVAADGDHVYASQARLYVATAAGMSGWGMTGRDVDEMTTSVHAFDISSRGGARYLASGDVPGFVIGRWALSEHEGRLRIATTSQPSWSSNDSKPSESSVYVLEESGDDLDVVGSVSGMGKTEQIRSVRWFGEIAVVVTFRQTDPLYTLDLSDPQRPEISGELKIPGYSAYLHPLGDAQLLGIGQDATDKGQVRGAMAQTFDLTDLTKPRAIDKLSAGTQTATQVEHDSRAFMYLPAHRRAILPVDDWETGTPRLWSVAVGTNGGLRDDASWSPGPRTQLVRAVPIGADRIAVVTEKYDNDLPSRTLTLLDVDGLKELTSS